jgi:hypothetical protein
MAAEAKAKLPAYKNTAALPKLVDRIPATIGDIVTNMNPVPVRNPMVVAPASARVTSMAAA